MGPMTLPQKVMAGTLIGAVILWMFGEMIGVSAVVAAMLGLSVLLLTGVLEWKDCLSATAAWDTLAWFAILIGMSNAMNDAGIITYFANQIGSVLSSMNLGWPGLFALLHVAFFYIHYLFASQTAHVGALYAAFLALMLSAGVPPMLAVLSLAFNVRSLSWSGPCTMLWIKALHQLHLPLLQLCQSNYLCIH
jgi:divalent anion:Na+ symporter, DASS family